MIKWIFQKELMLTKQIHEKNVTLVIIGTLKIYLYPYLCNGCHGLMQKAIDFNDVDTVPIKGSDYRIYFCYISKYEAISLMNNSNLNEKKWIIIIFFSLRK